MNEYKAFVKAGKRKAEDEKHRAKILKAVLSHEQQVTERITSQFHDWQEARHIAAETREYALQNLPDLLEQFEQNISARGTHVLWAKTAAEARQLFLDIVKKHGAQNIIKSKSMITEEIGINDICQQSGLNVLESDLGELIVQLSGEKPYHIVTPAMHKSRKEIAILFHEKLGIPMTEDVKELTMAARRHLRQAYIDADLGVTGANFLIAKEGAVSITENEGNARLSFSCPPIHVVLTGIEKVIPSLEDLSLFLPLLATSGTGQQITCYNSVIRGPRQSGETDGPEYMYIILLDNQRSTLYGNQKMRQSLRCIRCGSCLNACPVFRTIGGHSYHTTYQGPIGSVITPHLRDLKHWHHLSNASSLCAACTDVCPVEIELHKLLLENRYQVDLEYGVVASWKQGLKLWSHVFGRRSLLNTGHRIFYYILPVFKRLLPRSIRKRIPRIPKYTFAELWERDGQ